MTTTATAQRGQGGAPLEARIVTRTAPHYRDVVGLYRRAFPRQEQIPLWHMRLMALLPGVALNAWYDGQTMAGLTYTVESRRMIWLFYLAVNDVALDKYPSVDSTLLSTKDSFTLLKATL